MSSTFTYKALGLNNQPNTLESQPGSLTVAKNVSINRDSVVEPRRGMKIYGNSFGSTSERAKQLLTYKNRIIRHYGDTLEFDNGSGVFSAFSGSYSETENGLRIKYIEANGNLYFTTSDGIMKISAKDASDLTTSSGFITQTGAVKALDLSATLNYTYADQSSFLTQDSAVAYRAVWGYRDLNTNLFLGTPSQRVEIYNYLTTLLIRDFATLLQAIDNIGLGGSVISDKNYVEKLNLSSSADASDLFTNLTSLVSKLDNDIFYASNYNNLGTWDASTNTPTLFDNTVTKNSTYIVTTAGTQDLGNGSTSYTVDDILTYDGNGWVVNTDYSYQGTFDASEQFLGYWSAYSNTPTLADGTGTLNTFYKVSASGTQNLGSGSQSFSVGDYVKYNGTSWILDTGTKATLTNGTGIDNYLYRVSTAGTVDFGAGNVNLSVNDLLYYSGGLWKRLEDSLVYINDWNASTNSPQLRDNTKGNGDYYTVSVAGTQDLGNGSIAFSVGDRVMFDNDKWQIINYVDQGSWDASTNTPTLVNGTGTEGDYYTVSVAGTQNLGLANKTYSVGDRVMYVDGVWKVNSFNINTNSLLIIDGATIANGEVTVTFSSGNPSEYLISGSKIYLDGFDLTDNNLNGAQIVTSVDDTSLVFNTTLTGDIDLAPSATIFSNTFRGITAPSSPDIPATDAELVSLQDYILEIITQLNSLSDNLVSSSLKDTYLTSLEVTKSSSVKLKITIPEGINSNYFFQLYRSAVFEATDAQVLGTDVFPNDELQLVYEAYPTDTDITNGYVIVDDIVPDAFRGANLYTNASTGEGILQANDLPPLAKDINVFKNSVFYANTKTRHRKTVSLIGVQSMIDDYTAGTTPTLTIATSTGSNTYTFVTGQAEELTIQTVAGSLLASSGTASYFDINSANDLNQYRFWFKIGTATAPSDGGRTLVSIVADASFTANEIANKTRDALNVYSVDFNASTSTNTITISLTEVGYTTDASAGTSGFTINITQQGSGENASLKQILLSTDISPARAVEQTALSLTRVVNRNDDESIYIYYTSGAQEVPGQMIFEARSLNDGQFYIVTNNTNTGNSFNPTLAPVLQISNITVGTPTTMTVQTSTAHGLSNLDYVTISGSNSTPSIDGYYQITYVSSTEFRINKTITVAGTEGGVSYREDTEYSSNEESPNRVYYSKYQQPEAVPVLNYLEVGARDKAILRIFPLRDSLFIFKEDGLYRISGESIPFNLALFDSGCILVAPDSVASTDNIIYGWTRQGVASITESGTRNESRPIDVLLLPLASPNYPNFKTSTWGIGYESDKSYTVFTVSETTDEVATIAYKYNSITNTWTTIDKSYTCGVINFSDDKMYVGCGDLNSLEQERKNFTREDYADREYTFDIAAGRFVNNTITLDSIENIEQYDVAVQYQTISTYDFNALLNKLDIDPGINDEDYYNELAASAGADLRAKLIALAQKLDADSGTVSTDYESSISTKSGSITSIGSGSSPVITSNNHGLFTGRKVLIAGSNSSPTINDEFVVTVIDANNFSISGVSVVSVGTSGTFSTLNADFTDLRACFNKIIQKLNADSGVSFSNYMEVTTTTIQETLITNVNKPAKRVSLNDELDFIVGEFTVFKSIDCELQYTPNTFGGDPVSLKHIRECQIMFESLAFTQGIISFATDLLPQFEEVEFTADGNGRFGFNSFGSGFFGGASHAAPIRTYVPRNCQRCRFMILKFNHKVAREKWSLYGISLTGETQLSTRGYR